MYLRRTGSRRALPQVYRHRIFHISTYDTSRFVDCLLCFISVIFIWWVFSYFWTRRFHLCVFGLYQLTDLKSTAHPVCGRANSNNDKTNKQEDKATSPHNFSARYKYLHICGRCQSQNHLSDVIPVRLMSRHDGNGPSKIFLPYIIGIQR